jgi:MOSC domain-containing protein YiiM
MRVLRVRVGGVREYSSGEWSSAIAKRPVHGGAAISLEGIAGDEQADRVNHGGADKAILCYAREHYLHWQSDLGDAAPQPGTLGENFETEGITEETACIGDIFRVGSAEVQISQPRQPCWKPARLHGLPRLTAQILTSGRTGWYLRVLAAGTVAAPETIHLAARPHPEWTVARANRVMHFEKHPALRAELAALEALSAAWRRELEHKL